MDDFLTQRFAELIGRLHGPLNVRLYIQTGVGIILAIRAGLRDLRQGRSPYFWALAFNAGGRHELLGQGWKDISKLFVAALILDGVYQVIALHMVYPIEAIVVAILLAVVPYALVRAAIPRLFGKKKEKA